jgi:hypothetical protein
MCSAMSPRTPTTRRSRPERQVEFPSQSAPGAAQENLTRKARNHLARFNLVEQPRVVLRAPLAWSGNCPAYWCATIIYCGP